MKVIAAILGAVTLAAGGAIAAVGGGQPTVERVDFDRVARSTTPVYDARLAPASDANVKEFRIPIKDATIQIAPGVAYQGWTFGGTVPGPVLRVNQGDLVRITLVNESGMPHSIDLHSARIAPNVAYRSIGAGDSLTFEFTAADAGAFLVHCGTPPTLMHIMQGMYMPIIVDPRGGWGTHADKEFVLVQSEFYTKDVNGQKVMDYAAAQSKQPTYVVFNGRADQYKDNALQVNEGDRVRLFVVDAGPNEDSDFHIVGALFDRVYADGNPDHALTGVQTWTIPAGGGAVFETVFGRGSTGIYPFVTHSFADASKGAVGMIQVGQPKEFAHMDH